MNILTPKENLLEAVHFGKPEYVPMHNEDILYPFMFDNICKRTTWTDTGYGNTEARWRIHLRT